MIDVIKPVTQAEANKEDSKSKMSKFEAVQSEKPLKKTDLVRVVYKTKIKTPITDAAEMRVVYNRLLIF